MLSAIKDTVLGIGEFFSTIIDFVKGFITDSVNFIKQIPIAFEEAYNAATSIIPNEILILFAAALTVVIVLRVLGRD